MFLAVLQLTSQFYENNWDHLENLLVPPLESTGAPLGGRAPQFKNHCPSQTAGA